MPSYEQKYGVAPPATGVATLSQRERNHIRSKLGIANDPAQLLYQQTDARMTAFAQEQVDEARALYKALDEIGDATDKIQGGSRGLFISAADDRGVLRRELMNLIVPSSDILLPEQVPTVAGEETTGDEFFAIPVRYNNPTRRGDEFSCDED